MIYSSNVKYEEDAAHIDPASELPFERLFRKQLPSVDMTKRIYDQITKRTWFQSASVHDGAASLMGWFEARYRATMTEDQYLIVLQRVNETIQELYPSRYRPYTLDRKTKEDLERALEEANKSIQQTLPACRPIRFTETHYALIRERGSIDHFNNLSTTIFEDVKIVLWFSGY